MQMFASHCDFCATAAVESAAAHVHAPADARPVS